MTFLLYPLVGIVAGFLAGLLGLGGGIIIVPCLLFIFPLVGIESHIAVHMAIATSITIVVMTQISAVSTHKRYFSKNTLPKLARLLWPGIILGSISGALFATTISGDSLSLVFGIVVFLLALKVVFVKSEIVNASQQEFPWQLPHGLIMGVVMYFIGGLSAILGVSGGMFLVPFMQHFKVPMAKTVSTSAFCGLPLAVMATATYLLYGLKHTSHIAWSTGYIYWPAFVGIAATSMFFAPLGVKLAHRLPANVLRILFVVFLVFISLRMIFF